MVIVAKIAIKYTERKGRKLNDSSRTYSFMMSLQFEYFFVIFNERSKQMLFSIRFHCCFCLIPEEMMMF